MQILSNLIQSNFHPLSNLKRYKLFQPNLPTLLLYIISLMWTYEMVEISALIWRILPWVAFLTLVHARGSFSTIYSICVIVCLFLFSWFSKIFWTGVIEVMQYRIKSDAYIKPCPCPDAPGAFLLQPIVLGIFTNHRKVNIYLSSHFGFCFKFKEINITILLSAPDRLLSHVWRIWYQGWGTAARFKTVHADSFC